MKILITGGTGLLGTALVRSMDRNDDVVATYFSSTLKPEYSPAQFEHLDIRNKTMVMDCVRRYRPRVIIHTAAKSSPDYCETQQKDAYATNVSGTKYILEAAKLNRSRIFIMSSNQVFDGLKPPYSESSRVSPINEYGRMKVENEKEALKHTTACIMRLMTMYGWPPIHGTKNTAVWAMSLLSSGESISVVDNVYNNFLWAGQAAQIIWKIVKSSQKAPKILHIAGKDTLSRYEFVRLVGDVFGIDTKRVVPVPKSYFTDEAPRPLNTIYDTSLLRKKYGVRPMSIRDGLIQMKNEETNIRWESI